MARCHVKHPDFALHDFQRALGVAEEERQLPWYQEVIIAAHEQSQTSSRGKYTGLTIAANPKD